LGSMSINLAEKRLLTHIRMGGQPTDEVGVTLVKRFAQKAWSDAAVAKASRQYGLTLDELAGLYGMVIENLMPEPWMNAGGPMLVPTQWFMEPHRLESLLLETTREAPADDRQAWFATLIDKATELAIATRAAHDEQYGKPNVQITQSGGLKTSGGCASMIAFLSILGGTVVALLA